MSEVPDQKVPRGMDADPADSPRRRLLKLTAYAAPFLLSFSLPKSGWAAPGNPHGNSCPRPNGKAC